MTKDFPLEGGVQRHHPAGRRTRSPARRPRPSAWPARQGKAEALEDWLFANQPTLTLDGLKRAVRDIGGVADFDAQYPKVLGRREDRHRRWAASWASARRRRSSSTASRCPTTGCRSWTGHRARAEEGRRPQVNLPRPREPISYAVMPAIETHALAKDYTVGFWRPRPYRALDGLTLAGRARARSSASSGPNGAGKTTTLKLLMQLVYPTSGTASILGRPLGDLEMKRRIGYLPENPYFYDYLTAEELLTYFAGLFGYKGADRTQARRAPARRGRPRRRAPPAAAQVLEGDDPARRPGAGADQRPRGRSSSTSRCRASTRSAAATSAP